MTNALDRWGRTRKLLIAAACTSLLAFAGGLAAVGRGVR
jgi:hypothetical protein